jgi:hypothetical protein
MNTTSAIILIIVFFTLIFIVAFFIYRRKSKIEINGPFGTGFKINGSNHHAPPQPAVNIKNAKSRMGGVLAEDNTGRGVQIEQVEVHGDIQASSTNHKEEVESIKMYSPERFSGSGAYATVEGAHAGDINLYVNLSQDKNVIPPYEEIKFLNNPKDKHLQNDPSTDNSLREIQVKTQEFIKRYPSSFFDFTHADRAIVVLNNWLLDREQQEYLKQSYWTAFYLHGVIYLYQIGLCSHPQLQDVPEAKKADELGKYSATLINAFWQELGIVNRQQCAIFSQICEAYTSNEIKLMDKIPHQLDGEFIDVPFIVACLKLIYELDLYSARIPLLLARFSTNIPDDFSAKFTLLGIGPHSINSHSIIASFSCLDYATHQLLKQHEGHIQKLLHTINRNIHPRFQYTEIVYKIHASNYIPIDFKFEVDTSAALEIFLAPLYVNQAVFMRELLQNSLDACNLRLLLEPNYQPKISVERDLKNHTVKIKDDGIGMDIDSIRKYLLRIGVSFYNSQEFKDFNRLDVGFAPISRFGIGILSCFMAAEKILIRTKKSGSEGLEMEIIDFRNYFSVRVDPAVEQGTEITVILKPNLNVDVLGYMETNIKNPRFPIEYIFHNGETTIIEGQPFSVVDKLKRQFWKDDWKKYLEVKIPLLSASSQCFIAYQKVDNSQIPLYFNHGENDVIVLQDGIFICHAPDLLPRWVKQNLLCQIDLRGNDRLDLSASRHDFLRNEKYQNLKETIAGGTIKLLKQIMLQSLEQLNNHRENYHDILINFIRANVSLESQNGLLQQLLKEQFCFKVFISKKQKYHFFTELSVLDKPIDILYNNSNRLSRNGANIREFDAIILLYIYGITTYGNNHFRLLHGNIQREKIREN